MLDATGSLPWRAAHPVQSADRVHFFLITLRLNVDERQRLFLSAFKASRGTQHRWVAPRLLVSCECPVFGLFLSSLHIAMEVDFEIYKLIVRDRTVRPSNSGPVMRGRSLEFDEQAVTNRESLRTSTRSYACFFVKGTS